MTDATREPSARRSELLEAAYRYVLAHGQVDVSLRPLAAAIGSSPRVLLFLFGSKDGLVRTLLARARTDQLDLLRRAQPDGPAAGLGAAVATTWRWLSAEEHRPLLVLWTRAYTRSLTEPTGPWAGFARQTVTDWLDVLRAAQPEAERDTPDGEAARTVALAVLRGALLDLLATADSARTDRAVLRLVAALDQG